MTKRVLRMIWRGWLKAGLAIGNFVSGVVLCAFYFTIFALFAIPFRIFGRNPLSAQSNSSNWIDKKRTMAGLDEFGMES